MHFHLSRRVPLGGYNCISDILYLLGIIIFKYSGLQNILPSTQTVSGTASSETYEILWTVSGVERTVSFGAE